MSKNSNTENISSSSEEQIYSQEQLGEALIDCTRYNEIDDVKELVLKHNANINYQDTENKKTALHVFVIIQLFLYILQAAAVNGSLELVIFLIQNGAKHLLNDSGNTPLHWAALNGKDEIVKYLLAKYFYACI